MDYFKDKTEIKKYIQIIKNQFPEMNAFLETSRGKSPHIRINKNADIEKIISIFGNFDMKEQNTMYSTSYYTLFFNINSHLIPFVLSIGDLKVNKNDKIVTKQLTPSKIGLFGKFYSQQELINTIFILIQHFDSKLLNTLKSLCYKAQNINYIMPEEEFNFYKQNYASINKDFGEILTAIYLFNQQDVEYIDFPELNNQTLYDLTIQYKDGIREYINTKSERGSGQSFKTIPYKYIEEALNNESFQPNTYYHKFIQIMAIFHSTLNGRQKHIEMFKILSNGNDFLANIINDIKDYFYIDDFSTMKDLKVNIPDYNLIIKKIFLKYNVDAIGLPKEHPNFNLHDIIIFTISTIISKYHDQNIFNKTINKILTNNVLNICIKINLEKKSFDIEKKENPQYKIHYWANSKSPTNNLIGYKII